MNHSFFKPKHLQGRLSRRVYLVTACASFALFVLAWSFLAHTQVVNPLFLPSPEAVVQATYELFAYHGMAKDVLVSTYRILLGFALSALFAIPIGLLIGTYKIAEAFIEPFNDFIRYMPVVAFVPLTILWVGIGDGSKVLLIFLGTYFQLVLLVAAAASQTPKEYLEAYYLLGGDHRRVVRRVILPFAWPAIFDAMRVSAGWAWSYLVVAELVAAETGVGFKIIQALRFLKTDQIISGIIIVGLLGLTTDYAFKIAGRWLFPWTQSGTGSAV